MATGGGGDRGRPRARGAGGGAGRGRPHLPVPRGQRLRPLRRDPAPPGGRRPVSDEPPGEQPWTEIIRVMRAVNTLHEQALQLLVDYFDDDDDKEGSG